MSKVNDINNITLPVYKRLEADKDIISKIKISYDEQTEQTFITFPKGIVPLKFYSSVMGEDYIYFNYKLLCLVNSTNTTLENMSLASDNKVIIIYQREITEGTQMKDIVSELVYINMQHCDVVDSTLDFNAYYLFNPVTSGGTKLYQHDILCLNTPYPQKVKYISTKSTPLTFSELASYLGNSTSEFILVPYYLHITLIALGSDRITMRKVSYSQTSVSDPIVESVSFGFTGAQAISSIISDTVTDL